MHRRSRFGLFHQDRHGLPDVTGIKGFCFFIRQCKQTLASLVFLFRSHHMVYLQGLGSRTFRIAEHMQLGDVQSVNKFISFLKVPGSFAPGTYNHIHTDKRIGHHLFYLRNLRSKKFCPIAATHQLENFVTTGL